MKKTTLLIVLLVTFTSAFTQQNAITEKGEEVILFDNGSWEYVNQDYIKETEIKTNPEKFKKNSKSTFLVKSNKFNVGFWINPKIWSFNKSSSNEDAEYELTLKDGDLYGMVISEKVEIPLKTLKNIAIDNGKLVAPDIKIVNEEYRIVNGLKVLHLQMDGTMQGIKFSFFGYYFSSPNGTVQFVTYTSQNLLKSYLPICENLLNGLVELD